MWTASKPCQTSRLVNLLNTPDQQMMQSPYLGHMKEGTLNNGVQGHLPAHQQTSWHKTISRWMSSWLTVSGVSARHDPPAWQCLLGLLFFQSGSSSWTSSVPQNSLWLGSHVGIFVYVYVYMHMCRSVWKLEDDLECCSWGTHHLFFHLPLAWNSAK